MKGILTLIIVLIQFGLFSQNSDVLDNSTQIYLTQSESKQLTDMFHDQNVNFDFNKKMIAFVAGATGNILLSKKEFFHEYVEPVIKNKKKNVCRLIIFTSSEKIESGGYEAIVLTPVKIYSHYYQKKTIKILKTTR